MLDKVKAEFGNLDSTSFLSLTPPVYPRSRIYLLEKVVQTTLLFSFFIPASSSSPSLAFSLYGCSLLIRYKNREIKVSAGREWNQTEQDARLLGVLRGHRGTAFVSIAGHLETHDNRNVNCKCRASTTSLNLRKKHPWTYVCGVGSSELLEVCPTVGKPHQPGDHAKNKDGNDREDLARRPLVPQCSCPEKEKKRGEKGSG